MQRVSDAVKNPLVYWTLVVGVVAAAVCVRCLVALQPYSGMGQPPEYGDFEAQRHWMELTVNLDVHEWYVNGTHNNLTYWGIDYPPLTAYFSWAWGKLFVFLFSFIPLFPFSLAMHSHVHVHACVFPTERK